VIDHMSITELRATIRSGHNSLSDNDGPNLGGLGGWGQDRGRVLGEGRTGPNL